MDVYKEKLNPQKIRYYAGEDGARTKHINPTEFSRMFALMAGVSKKQARGYMEVFCRLTSHLLDNSYSVTWGSPTYTIGTLGFTKYKPRLLRGSHLPYVSQTAEKSLPLRYLPHFKVSSEFTDKIAYGICPYCEAEGKKVRVKMVKYEKHLNEIHGTSCYSDDYYPIITPNEGRKVRGPIKRRQKTVDR